jgi:AraC-like DNA-binding protein
VLQDHYGVDPEPLLAAAGIDSERIHIVGSRVSRASVLRLWELAVAATNDPSIGLVVGSKVRPTSFHALGIAFLTCETLQQALEALVRFYNVIVTVPLDLEVKDFGAQVELRVRYASSKFPLPQVPFDSFIASIVALCRIATTSSFAPLQVRLRIADNGRSAAYQAFFNAPAVFAPEADFSALVFSSESLATPLPGSNIDVHGATDRILEEYVAALNPDEVGSEVRTLLLQMLPTGSASQDAIAKKMHMSRSTLQRRLHDERTNYRELLESTRRTLALEYVRSGEHPLSYVAFLLGFSDQSNFSRAFRRWTGVSPKTYQER